MHLQLTPVAERDLARIFDFNEERSWQRAAQVEQRLAERMRSLLLTPNTGRPLADTGVKRLSVPDIQYMIDYEVADDSVRILRVRHTREVR